MKKIGIISLIVIISLMVFLVGFSYNRPIQPNTYYNVYLDGKLIGTIESKTKLEKYINSQGSEIKANVEEYSTIINAIDSTNQLVVTISNDEYNSLSTKEKVEYLLNKKESLNISDIKAEYLKKYLKEKLYDLTEKEIKEVREYVEKNEIYKTATHIYVPNGIEIKKVNTYDSDIKTVEQIYRDIILEKSPTIAGYRFTIKPESGEENIIYVADKKLFEEAIDSVASIFIGEDEYQKYKTATQTEITNVGTIIENVYVQEDINYKAINVGINEKIYTDSKELSKYLLYGDSYEQKVVTVNSGESISKVAYDNEISVEEFLISNPEYTSRNNLLYEGKQVVISKINPKINIVVETHSISDVETNYGIVEQYDSTLNQGNEIVTQEGEKGLERVTQNVQSVNGQIIYVEPISKETIKSSVSKVITVGTKYIATVGSTTSWGWPTNSGYTLSSYYGYRYIGGSREFHSGLDIAGTGYGSPIYATNNGTIEEISYAGSYGNHIIINHGNGYWTNYAHMSRFASGLTVGSVVARGDIIGYVGSTGRAFGPHLHYEIRKGCGGYNCVTDPLAYYR